MLSVNDQMISEHCAFFCFFFFIYKKEVKTIYSKTLQSVTFAKTTGSLVSRTVNTNCVENVKNVKYYHCESHSKTWSLPCLSRNTWISDAICHKTTLGPLRLVKIFFIYHGLSICQFKGNIKLNLRSQKTCKAPKIFPKKESFIHHWEFLQLCGVSLEFLQLTTLRYKEKITILWQRRLPDITLTPSMMLKFLFLFFSNHC